MESVPSATSDSSQKPQSKRRPKTPPSEAQLQQEIRVRQHQLRALRQERENASLRALGQLVKLAGLGDWNHDDLLIELRKIAQRTALVLFCLLPLVSCTPNCPSDYHGNAAIPTTFTHSKLPRLSPLTDAPAGTIRRLADAA
jgi:hypothetical protein